MQKLVLTYFHYFIYLFLCLKQWYYLTYNNASNLLPLWLNIKIFSQSWFCAIVYNIKDLCVGSQVHGSKPIWTHNLTHLSIPRPFINRNLKQAPNSVFSRRNLRWTPISIHIITYPVMFGRVHCGLKVFLIMVIDVISYLNGI